MLTNLVAVVDGEVKYIQAVILYPERRGKKVQSMKFPAKDLFDLAPDTAAYSLMKKFSELTFQLGRTYSDGMEASRLTSRLDHSKLCQGGLVNKGLSAISPFSCNVCSNKSHPGACTKCMYNDDTIMSNKLKYLIFLTNGYGCPWLSGGQSEGGDCT